MEKTEWETQIQQILDRQDRGPVLEEQAPLERQNYEQHSASIATSGMIDPQLSSTTKSSRTTILKIEPGEEAWRKDE